MHVCERERHLCKKLRSITCIQVLITKTTKHPMIKNKLMQSRIKTSTLCPLLVGDQGGDLTSRRHYTGTCTDRYQSHASSHLHLGHTRYILLTAFSRRLSLQQPVPSVCLFLCVLHFLSCAFYFSVCVL